MKFTRFASSLLATLLFSFPVDAAMDTIRGAKSSIPANDDPLFFETTIIQQGEQEMIDGRELYADDSQCSQAAGANDWNKRLFLSSFYGNNVKNRLSPNIPPALLKRFQLSVTLSQGVYYGKDINLKTMGIDSKFPWSKKFDSAFVGFTPETRTCYVMYHGKDLDDGLWKMEYFSDLSRAQDIAKKTHNSDFSDITTEDASKSCSMNHYLTTNWRRHFDPRTEGTDKDKDGDTILDAIVECMDIECIKYNGIRGDCDIVYGGHSAGGVSAMATALYLKDTNRFNASETTIVSFGQPGTFESGDCTALDDLEDRMFRFITLQHWHKNFMQKFVEPWKDLFSSGSTPSEGTVRDAAPAIGGDHMGYTIFATGDSKNVKLYHYDNDDVAYGSSIVNWDSTGIEGGRKVQRLMAHQITKYKSVVTGLESTTLCDMDPSNPNYGAMVLPTRGFFSGGICASDEHCKAYQKGRSFACNKEGYCNQDFTKEYESCSEPEQCNSSSGRSCYDNMCRECSSHDHCPGNQFCTKDYDWGSKFKKWRCESKRDYGKQCFESGDCERGWCHVSGKCLDCDGDYMCDSDEYCTRNNGSDIAGSATRKCESKKSFGGSCKATRQCKDELLCHDGKCRQCTNRRASGTGSPGCSTSQYCNEDYKCVDKKGHGEKCGGDDYKCQSDQCKKKKDKKVCYGPF